MGDIIIEWKQANPPGKQGGQTKVDKAYGHGRIKNARQEAIGFLNNNGPDDPKPDPNAVIV